MVLCTVAIYRLLDIFIGIMLLVLGIITIVNVSDYSTASGRPIMHPFALVMGKAKHRKEASQDYGMRNIYFSIAVIGAWLIAVGLLFLLCAMAVLPWPHIMYNYSSRGLVVFALGLAVLGLDGALGFILGIIMLVYGFVMLIQGAPYLNRNAQNPPPKV